MPDPRLLCDEPLSQDRRVQLGESQSRKLTTVLRLGPGAPIRLFNARDGEWRADIETRDRHTVTVRVRDLLRAPRAAPDIELLFAPVKRDATDWIVEKATELGVHALRPVITARTIAETVRLDRMALIARNAAEQTERFDLPVIGAPAPLSKVLDDWPAARPLIYADESGEVWGGEQAIALVDAIAELRPPLSVLIGPEGGFTDEERRLLRSRAFVTPVSLGPRILRAETAAVAVLSVVQAIAGDWRG